MVHFWKKKKNDKLCREPTKDASPFATAHSSGSTEGSIEVTVGAATHHSPTDRSHSTTEENVQPQPQNELYRFGAAFGWATTDATPTKSSSPTFKKMYTIDDLSETARQHYTALQAWKDQHAEFLQRTSSKRDNEDAADAEEWQQAMHYTYQHHRSNGDMDPKGTARRWNRVIAAPHGMMANGHQHCILYVLPAGLDLQVPLPNSPSSKSAIWDLYTTALALYLYRTLILNNTKDSSIEDDKVTIVLDVRSGGSAWPNPGVLSLLAFIRHVARVLPRFFPSRVHEILVVPIPGWACQLHHVCVAPLLPAALRLTLVAGPSTAATAALPESLASHLLHKDDDLARLEQLRCAAIRAAINEKE